MAEHGALGGASPKYRQTSGLARLGIYLWATGRSSDTTDQAMRGEGAVARLAWVIAVALIALALWLGVG